MVKVQVFDPAMCCPTGVCGPSVDPVLPRFAADLGWLKDQGVEVERYNLSQEPTVFAANDTVRSALKDRGQDVLPLVLIDGRIVAEGTYPGRETLAALAGIRLTKKLAIMQPAESAACCSDEEAEAGCCSSDDEDEASCGDGEGSSCC
jgi:hypothetical protein